VRTLKAGLDSNRLIGTAVGVLMERHQLSREVAFAHLLRVSQDSNVKLVEVARRMVEQGAPAELS
jgi:response regulator NasT